MSPFRSGCLSPRFTGFLTGLLSLALIQPAIAQGGTQGLRQVVRGTVIDQTSEAPLPGATVILKTAEGLTGVITDADGVFRAEGVPVGRIHLEVRYVGYEPRIIPELMVSSARPLILEIRLQELAEAIEGVEVRAQPRKDIPINRMAFASARTFTVEETRRFAGGFDDPGRMAASFAGVAGGSPNDNALSIRGNAPKNLLWRIEGVPVPNPNHFAGMLVEGGGIVSLVSGQLLSNSDFFTGAFPTEYGNALSGVFDMNLRVGNEEKRGWGIQAGTLGLDGFGEGPLRKGKKASYLFNYRYSTTALLKDLIPEGQVPIFQDLSIKLNFPTKRTGIFSLWGIGGLDRNGSQPLDSLEWESPDDQMRFRWDGRIGIVGLKHKLLFHESSALNTSLTASHHWFADREDFYQPSEGFLEFQRVENRSATLRLSSVLTHKFSRSLSARSGFILSRLGYGIDLRAAPQPGDPAVSFGEESGSTSLLQAFTQVKWDGKGGLSLTGGLHTMRFLLNQSSTLEPRVGANYTFRNGNSLGLAYGNHSMIEPLPVYFYRTETPTGDVRKPNRNLPPSRAHHLVLTYKKLLLPSLRLSAEAYYQHLYHIPASPDSEYSLINFRKEYLVADSLSSQGTGTNRGIDLTLEKFLGKQYYFLLTGSWIDSRYTNDGIHTYPSRWDYGYVLNLLGGYEFRLGPARDHILGLNLRTVLQGGERTHPVDPDASRAAGTVVYDLTRPWSDRYPPSFFLDFTATLRINKPRHTSTWGIQIKNLLLEESIYYHTYDPTDQSVQLRGQGFIFPNLSYKIEF
ncbi:MAG: TonB-dependent receptor [Bacteroidales bacterium]